jgi:outer membrane biosynthesis protein TonB
MSDQMDDLVGNLKESSQWIRILFMIAFAAVLYLVMAPIILVLMLAQALFALFSGKSNDNLRVMGDVISQYVYQILRFVSYNDERKPFPFSDFPTAGAASEAKSSEQRPEPSANKQASEAGKEANDRSAESVDTQSPASGKKPARKKAAKKKTVSKKKATAKASKDKEDKEGKQDKASVGEEAADKADKEMPAADKAEATADAGAGDTTETSQESGSTEGKT